MSNTSNAVASKKLYLIGSLRNERIPELARRIRNDCPDVEVFDDWYAAGPEADDYWKSYEKNRGRSYQEALEGYAAKHVFAFDKHHLDTSSHVLLVLPAGKSGHMELMYGAYAVGATSAILLDPDDVRWDVMYQFIPTILENDDGIRDWLSREQSPGRRRREGTVSDGGRITRLFSECSRGGGQNIKAGWRQASSRRAAALGTREVN